MTDLQRDRYGRPLVVPPGGGKPVAYTRCTSFVSVLEDTYNLSRWQQRQVAVGLAQRPDLVSLAGAKADDKGTLNEVVDAAMEAAQSSRAANVGTTIHALTELVDAGADLASIPAEHRADLEAYARATEFLRHEHIEAFTVHDTLRIGGTPDRISTLPDGRRVIADVKTGSVEYGMGKIAQQLAVYAHSFLYDTATHDRTEHHADTAVGIVIHLPAGSGTCELIEVDLAAGWQAVQLSAQVRAWRARKDLARPFTIPEPPKPKVAEPAPDPILAMIAACDDVEALNGVYALHLAEWTDRYTAAAAERKAAILRGAA